MRINPDCVRDILTAIEDTTSMQKIFSINQDNCPSIFPQYDLETVMYHIRQCDLNGYLYNASYNMEGGCHVMDLMPIAHEFLANIREDTNWNKVKNISKKVGSSSLSVLAEIAANVISAVMQSYLR